MSYNPKIQKENLALIEKINHVFLGTRDFRSLADQTVKLIVEEVKGEGIVSAAIFRVHTKDKSLYAYSYASRSFGIVDKLFPKRFSELNVSLSEETNLLVKTLSTREAQESNRLYDFSRPALTERTANAIQKVMGFGYAIAYPLRMRQGKVAGVVLFGVSGGKIEDQQRVLLDAFRLQLELAFENVTEFEYVVERYKRSIAKTFTKTHEENIPTVRLTLRITPKQNILLEKRAMEKGMDKTSFIRSLIEE